MHRTQNSSVSAADTDDMTEVVITPATTLRGAAHYLTVHGWTQTLYYSDKKVAFPPACADGAIGMAAFGGIVLDAYGRESGHPNFRDYNRAFHYFTGYLQDLGWKPPCDPWCGIEPGDCLCDNDHDEIIFAWNDDDTRTVDEVIAALRAAADEYDWQHATPEQLAAFADTLIGTDPRPVKEAFIAWLGAR